MKKKFWITAAAAAALGAYYYGERTKKYNVPQGYRMASLLTTPSWMVSNQKLVDASNALLEKISLPVPEDVHVRHDLFDGVPVTIYSAGNEPAPIVVYLHGGAFCWKNAPYFHDLMGLYARESGCTIVFAHYRCEAYPAPFADAIRVFKHVYETTNVPIGIAGDSAGGTLAAALTLWARDNHADVQAQMLVYPALDMRMETASMKEFTDSPVWNAKANKAMWQRYNANNDTEFMQYISPALETDFSGLPATLIEAEEYDCLRDEAIEYGQKLCDAGIAVHTYLNKGLFHGFEICWNEQTKEIARRRAARLKEMMFKKEEEIFVEGVSADKEDHSVME